MLRGSGGAEQACSETAQDAARNDSAPSRDKSVYRVDPRYVDRAVSSLELAKRILVRDGWDRVASPCGTTLFAAIWDQPCAETVPECMGPLEARRLLERLCRCWLFEWDALPLSSQGAALELLDTALRICGAEPRPVRRGGWLVSHSSRRSA